MIFQFFCLLVRIVDLLLSVLDIAREYMNNRIKPEPGAQVWLQPPGEDFIIEKSIHL